MTRRRIRRLRWKKTLVPELGSAWLAPNIRRRRFRVLLGPGPARAAPDPARGTGASIVTLLGHAPDTGDAEDYGVAAAPQRASAAARSRLLSLSN
jgi:hypothetical protein